MNMKGGIVCPVKLLAESQVEGDVCPDCGRPVEKFHEESYF